MSECPVCGDLDYQEVAGYFYCTTCNTQSQDTRVIEVDTESFASLPSASQTIRFKKEKKQTKGSKNKLCQWSVYEAYQVILLNQVEALIDLGAKPELKEVVFKLWANYLAIVGVAFTNQDISRTLLEYKKKRKDFSRKSEAAKKRRQKHKENKSKKKQKKGPTEDDDDDELACLKMFELDSSDESDAGGKSESSEDEFEVEMAKELSSVEDNRRLTRHKDFQRMTIAQTLAFCYLGLMKTNPLVTIVDLVRLAKQAKVPYMESKILLPPEMQSLNVVQEVQVVPSREEMRKKVIRLGYHLGLTEEAAVAQFPLAQLVHKFIVQLDLPAEFHGWASVLLERGKKEILKQTKMLFWEGHAMAYIVILLKLFFGINDQSERLFSRFSRDLNKLYFDGEERLFVWDRWIRHVADKIELFNTKATVSASGKIVDNEVTDRLGRPITIWKEHKGEKLVDAEFRRALQQPFLDLFEKMSEGGERNKGENSTSSADAFEFSQRSTIDNETMGLMLDIYDEEDEDGMPSELSTLINSMKKKVELDEEQVVQRGQKFRKCSMQHMLDPKEFVLQHEGAQAPDSPVKDGPGVDGADLGSQSSSQSSGNISYFEQRYSDTLRFKNVLKHYDYTKESYYFAVLDKKSAGDSATLKWVNHLVCKFIDCKPLQLQNMVSRLETAIRNRFRTYRKRKKEEEKWLGDPEDTLSESLLVD